ncbi:hypothetical protein [Streptomyces sp. NPDC021224]|uniref:hypothetical protein n=1 Tax=unclassified Streptomyces TaxID=2593676 RepID=UPI003795DD2D
MPEITPDLSDPNRCVVVHWVLPVQCVLPSSHREDHEAWHPQSSNRIKFCGESVAPSTHELHDGAWHLLDLPRPGAVVCGEPYSRKPDVTCQEEHGADGSRWQHRALVDGCLYSWSTPHARPVTPQQLDHEVRALRARVADLEQQRAAVAEARAAALAVLGRPNMLMPEVTLTSPVRWRVIVGDSESMDSIAPVCPATADVTGLHVIADYPGGPIQDETGVYDCCPTPWIEVGSGEIAAYLVALLNADTEAGERS